MTAMPQELFSLEVADLNADSSNITALVRRAATGDMQAWNLLVDQYGRLIWSITARNECLRHVAARKRLVLVHEDAEFDGVDHHGPEVDEALLAAERAQVVREAMAHLPAQWQQLLELLMADPPISYAEISDQLGLPVGSIGPTRGRCLAKLRVLLEAS